MPSKLLIVDPQNDFCDIAGAALPVTGANADMQRLAQLMAQANADLSDIVVTLDSHATVGIERITFWCTAQGESAAPFTQISAADVRAGHYRPRDPAHGAAALDYLDALERGGRYRLVVWPVHCVLGTWGHNIHADVAARLADWERRVQRPAHRVLKGRNPMTEQYSAVCAEVPLERDASTQWNRELVELARPGDAVLLVAGEAASHCVAATMEHLFQAFTPDERSRVIILRDCMSAVAGFEAQAARFFADAQARGARVMTAAEAPK